MKVKDLIKKYPNYKVVIFGRHDMVPYSMLPKELHGLTGEQFDKVLMELEVEGFALISEPCTVFSVSKKEETKYKGTLEIYLTKSEG